ncbi:MAG: T9SS type A sorting domain-containing protein [Bacteroidia bacterium]
MKKILLSIIAVLGFSQVYSQYYCIPFKNEGQNPKDLNKDAENPYPSTPAGWTVLWNGDENSTPTYTSNQNIPFSFKFDGTDVTQYKVSNAGFVTFSTSSTSNLTAFGNSTLPNVNVPDNSVCLLGLKPKSRVEGGTTLKSAIMTKTFGTAPNRQHWIQFNIFGDPNIQAGWSFWSIVLEESTNIIYIVDMRTLCVTSAGQICGNNVKLSAGIQINNTKAIVVDGSPNLGSGNIVTNISTVADNSYYTFRPGIQPTGDLAGIKVTVADYLVLANAPFTISGTFMNQGSSVVNSFDFAYKINNGTPVAENVASTIAINAKASVNHPTKWTPTLEGTYKVAIWPTNVNGSNDGLAANDTVYKNVIVVPAMIERKTLNEIFTSSTCGPCAPGNKHTDENIFPNREGKFTVIKYQQDFPGSGDPYATTEAVNRRAFYSINSIPRMEVDGGWNSNATAYTLALFDQFQAEPAFIKIEAKHDLQFGNTIKVDVKITPLVDFNNSNLKMFIAINEKSTSQNIKSNGETEFSHVMKKMLPNENGLATGTLTKNVVKNMPRQSYKFNGSYRLPMDGQAANRINLATENSIEEMSDLEVVVFIQDVVTKKVYQSEYSVGTIGAIDNAEGLKQSFVIYPNPSNGNTTVKFKLENSHSLSITLYNSLGQEVKVLDSRMFDNGTNRVDFSTVGLTPGLYFVKINGEGFTTTQNFIVN